MQEKTIENALYMLVKFGSEENLTKLQHGQLYMKNLQYYVDLEKNTSDEDVGDKYDGQMMLEDTKVTLVDYETKELFREYTATRVSMGLGFSKCPVFCIFSFDDRNRINAELNGDNLRVRYEFTEEQRTKLNNFGTHALIIENTNEFIERIQNSLLSNEIGYSRGFVQYYSFNNIEHFRQVKEDNTKIAFWKRQKYAYQQEYRFLAHTTVDDHLIIDIGNITHITQLVETKSLLNTYVEGNYGVKIKE